MTPEGYEDITERKPLKECTKADLEGTFYNLTRKEIGTQKVYSETLECFYCDLFIEGKENSSEGYFYKDSDKIFPPENYLKVKKLKPHNKGK